ncbi:lipoprotein [Streptomyces genisteinicus]|uniref:DUF3558 domain-containing protein n=1 Tax=Streptomyces genisteinicus TaxID=2768068 RepID=A0A7H0HVE6_9ACTN|nr:lipoprotein [Streptomyces genisteinicus]QNP64512.1 hypothetical protein IAG43_17395 [Streptomyces genisteinicus]
MGGVTWRRARTAVAAAAAATALCAAASGCGAPAGPDTAAASAGAPGPGAGDGEDGTGDGNTDGATDAGKDANDANDANGPVEAAGSVGAAGSACGLPVAFDLAEGWEPEAVEQDPGGEFAALLEQGTVSLRCEIDAKPAGHIGFLRVWVGGTAGDDPRAALEAFVADAAADREEEVYAPARAGRYEAVEARWLNTGELLDAPKRERAFAVTTADGVVIVDLGGLDTEEHEQMLPAYELARKSLRDS